MPQGAGTGCPRAVGTARSGGPRQWRRAPELSASRRSCCGACTNRWPSGGGVPAGLWTVPAGLGFQVGKGVRSWGKVPPHDPRTVSSFFPVPPSRGGGGRKVPPSARLLPAAPAPQPRLRVRCVWVFVEEGGAREEVALCLWGRGHRGRVEKGGQVRRPCTSASCLFSSGILPPSPSSSAPRSLTPPHTHPLPAQAALPFEPEAYCQGRVESSESRDEQSIVWEIAPEKPRRDLWAHDDTPSFLLKNIIPGVQLLRS